MDPKKVIMITGASRGIGATIAKTLAGPGTILALTHYDKDEEGAKAVQAEVEALGSECRFFLV